MSIFQATLNILLPLPVITLLGSMFATRDQIISFLICFFDIAMVLTPINRQEIDQI